MGDGEPLTVDFDGFSKGMSFYSPEHLQKALYGASASQQLDRSNSEALINNSEQLYSSPDLPAAEQIDKLPSKSSLENNEVTDMGETRSELQNGVHRSKENGAGDAGMESLMTSLGQLALAQSGAVNTRRTVSWDEQTLSSAMYHLLAQSGNGHPAGQQRVGTTVGSMSSLSPNQLDLGNVPARIQHGSVPNNNNMESYQSWNDGSVPVQGSWARHNVHSNGSSWVPNQRRALSYIPSGHVAADPSVNVPKLRQNSPFPKSLQHLVATNKTSNMRSCENVVYGGNCFQQVCGNASVLFAHSFILRVPLSL